jgi:hypothetical protein
LYERKRQEQEDDKRKNSLLNNNQDPVKVPDKKDDNINIPNQYTKLFIDESLEEADKNSNLYESDQETGYDFWTSERNIHTSISINNALCNKCMNLLFLPE